jgi:hypothetical protein
MYAIYLTLGSLITLFRGALKSLVLWRLHRKIEKEFKIQEKILNNAINTTVYQYRRIDESLFPALKQFFNIGLYFLLAERDVQALKADALAHPNETKRNIALRALLLTIYEWDMGKVTGKRMNNIYQITGMSDESKSSLVEALRKVKSARQEVLNRMCDARNNTIAHRDPNAIRQYEIISDLEIMDFESELTIFYVALDQLLRAMTPALREMGSAKSLFHQIINQVSSVV